MMRKQMELEIKVGLFISIGLGLVMFAILLLGGTENMFSSKNRYKANFHSVDGLIVGAKVILGGVPVGTVESINLDPNKRQINVVLSALKSSSSWIRQDSTVEIATQGVLGDKYLNVNVGSDQEKVLPPGSEIPARQGQDISQFLSKGDQLMISLNAIAKNLDKILKSFETENRSEVFFQGMTSAAKNLSQVTDKVNHELDQIQLKRAVANLNQIFEKINNGTGTIGALINDPGLYDEMKALMGGVNRNRIIRNLVRQAIKENESSSPRSEPTEQQKK